jgi:hypothetical protein
LAAGFDEITVTVKFSPPLLCGVLVVTVSSSSTPLSPLSVCVVVEPLEPVTVCETEINCVVTPSFKSLLVVRVTEFVAVWVTIWVKLVTVVPADSVTVSVSVLPLKVI